ncbi:MAG TPA: L-serine ammonia-lyase, iron-sulfur-dependent, subunit alpha [Verrucomicrobiota bacterium]|nr:L-serine ammonia-lyase, iron-sulfur-dependent, subunit alpha [Verrucomicrobiota bacterium]HNU53207.1 L-serine ammonia-lyase, iron-sulfur-dependent, subunit alpha [Verrucomicrobiota bacterium]
MNSLRQLYRIGCGPSSSHTIAPQRAATQFANAHPAATAFRVTLYGSLAATGRGHLTDRVLAQTLAPRPVEILWEPAVELPPQPNGMRLEALDADGRSLGETIYHSAGGGALLGEEAQASPYPFTCLGEVLDACEHAGETYWEYVSRCEGPDLWAYLGEIWNVMGDCVERGLRSHGALPGGLGLPRKAASLHRKASLLGPEFRSEALLAAYAYAVSEENAAGGVVVTAPTCGAAGVLPAILYHFGKERGVSTDDMVRALATAGLFGNVVKRNGSISGAVVGCQGEVGTACAMGAAAAAQLLGASPRQIEYAAEMGLEHHFGLTCDPVAGLVQIPCIERNAHAATRSLSCARFAMLSDGLHRISFDDAVAVMLETGRALPRVYRETALGGLAQVYARRLAERSPGK